MPISFEISTATGGHPVRIEAGLLAKTLSAPGDRVYIVDTFFDEFLRDAGIDAIAIDADESAKSIDRIGDVIAALRARGANRATTLVAIGGGVVQDIAAFVAAIYMRGIPWVYMPTTLLSMTDSCIGGKSSINVGEFKNLVGTFYPPTEVAIDPDVARTLSREQIAAGLCEAAKICLCRGRDQFDAYMATGPGVVSSAATLVDVIGLSLRAKKWFIEIDEFDRNERLLLNFGHTFGHAIEAATDFAVSHGIAVGLGMLAAIRMGEAMGHDYRAVPHIARFRRHIAGLLTAVPSLSHAVGTASMARLMSALEADKKHNREYFAVILPDASGAITRVLLPRDRASRALIEQAFAATLLSYREISERAAA